MVEFTVKSSAIGRLDKYLSGEISFVSRSFINKLFKDQKVRLNDKLAKASQKIRVNDHVIIDFDFNQDLPDSDIKLKIIYEDTDTLVIEKPVGILSHSKGAY